MTRALIIEPSANLWGSERALLEFIARMPGVECAVCCPPEAPLIPELKKLSVRIFPYFGYALHEKGRLSRLWAATGVIRACFQFRPELIYLNQGGCYRVALLAAVLFDLPIIAHVRIFEDIDYFSRRRPSPRRLHGIIAISLSIAKDLRRHPALAAIPQHVMYDSYVPVARSGKCDSARRIGNRIACVGRIIPNKGQDLLIEAIHYLVESGNNIDCIIIGDGPISLVQKLKTAAESGPGGTHINWLGIRADVVALLSTCAVVVCPSHREPLGRVIFEAWDAGAVPVACSTSAGAAELIRAAEGGILYDEQTPESLAKAMLAAVRLSQEEVARLIGNGRAWMSKHCNPIEYGAAMAKILHSASAAYQKNENSISG